jgi:hypothetical protein
VPQHLRPLADRRAANRGATRSVAAAFIVALIFFGSFYLLSRLKAPSSLGATSAPESQPLNP